MLLQLVAHQPPKILWTGPGDQITTEGGCISEQLVEFEMLFRTRLERFNITRSRPVAGGKPGGLRRRVRRCRRRWRSRAWLWPAVAHWARTRRPPRPSRDASIVAASIEVKNI